MNFIARVEARLDDRSLDVCDVAQIERDAQRIDAGELGLTPRVRTIVVQ